MDAANILSRDGTVIERIRKEPAHINVLQVLFTVLRDYPITNVVNDTSAKDPNFRFKAKMKGKPVFIVVSSGPIKKSDDVLNKLKKEFPDRKLTIESKKGTNAMSIEKLIGKTLAEAAEHKAPLEEKKVVECFDIVSDNIDQLDRDLFALQTALEALKRRANDRHLDNIITESKKMIQDVITATKKSKMQLYDNLDMIIDEFQAFWGGAQ